VRGPDLPDAAIRTQVPVHLQLPDGYATTALVSSFSGLVDGREHLALRLGTPTHVPLVRPHSECLTGDVFGNRRCDCGPQLGEAVERIAAAGGYLLYLRQEGRGVGLYDKLDAYALQDTGLDTYEANLALGHAADERDYTVAAQMLRALGVSTLALLTNNPDKEAQLERLGVVVAARAPRPFTSRRRTRAISPRRLATVIRAWTVSDRPEMSPTRSRSPRHPAGAVCVCSVSPLGHLGVGFLPPSRPAAGPR
jgi:GTP cyclohydrolase II